ncbi:TerB family tellurite resistance protein [Sphingomonas olei]
MTELIECFSGVNRVLADADAHRFKRQLRIGGDVYWTSRVTKGARSAWDVGGMALTGGQVAASSWVATTFFAPTGWSAFTAALGVGTAAATPVGWVALAAVATGGVYWGVTRMIRDAVEPGVDVVPHFINSPVSALAVSLLDLMGPLAMRVAAIDGRVDPAESSTIAEHFIEVWGYDPDYIAAALALYKEASDTTEVKPLAQALADFQKASPDCNAAQMQEELLSLLREVVMADGHLDEREQWAIAAVEAEFATSRAFSPSATLKSAGEAVSTMTSRARSIAERALGRSDQPC